MALLGKLLQVLLDLFDALFEFRGTGFGGLGLLVLPSFHKLPDLPGDLFALVAERFYLLKVLPAFFVKVDDLLHGGGSVGKPPGFELGNDLMGFFA